MAVQKAAKAKNCGKRQSRGKRKTAENAEAMDRIEKWLMADWFVNLPG